VIKEPVKTDLDKTLKSLDKEIEVLQKQKENLIAKRREKRIAPGTSGGLRDTLNNLIAE